MWTEMSILHQQQLGGVRLRRQAGYPGGGPSGGGPSAPQAPPPSHQQPGGYGPVVAPETAPTCCSCQQGPPGPVGPPGDDGDAGEDGKDGQNGNDGKDGSVLTSAIPVSTATSVNGPLNSHLSPVNGD